jgi:hypothetical protein
MSEPLRFTTVRAGVIVLTLGEHVFETDVRILRDSNGNYRLLAGTLSEPLPTIEDALSRAEAFEHAPSDVSREVRWRDDDAPLGPGERPCPICGAPAFALPRYLHPLCSACVMEATDQEGRPLRFRNTSASGGFEARYADDWKPYDSDECFVRGVRCRTEEHRFGGIVVQPITA